jgi:glycosyltransferase involved in cell wall biosynthesis
LRKKKLKYHIALKHPNHLTKLKDRNIQAQQQKSPREDIWILGEKLEATFHVPDFDSFNLKDRVFGQLTENPHFWNFARRLASELGENDFIFCEGENLAIPMAALCCDRSNRPKIAAHLHNMDRPRLKLALKLFRSIKSTDIVIVHCLSQYNFLQKYLNLSESQIRFWWYPVDCDYFKPGKSFGQKTRPTIVSVGLEMRDYGTLAKATESLDLDVKIAGFSQFRPGMPRTFPEVMPANMSNGFYQLPELLQLYHNADIVVVCVHPSNWSAGLTALLEAMACKRPVVVTRTEGLTDYLKDIDAFTIVEPGDYLGLQKSILHLLNNPQEAEEKAEKAYHIVNQRNRIEKQMGVLAEWLSNER